MPIVGRSSNQGELGHLVKNLATILQKSAKRHPERRALIKGEQILTYGALADQVSKIAAGLKALGLCPGDRIATFLPNGFDLVKALLAAAWAELICVPISPMYATPQIDYILRHSGSRGLISNSGMLTKVSSEAIAGQDFIITADQSAEYRHLDDLLRESAIAPVCTMADPIGLLVYTSGTTSRPKGVAHSQQRLASRVELFAVEMGLTADDCTISLVDIARPIFMMGQLLPLLDVGGHLHFPESSGLISDAKLFWSNYEKLKPTYLVTSPTIATQMTHHEETSRVAHDHLRFWIVGGDKAPASLHQRMSGTVGKPLLEMCGMTETGFYAINPYRGPVKIGSIGLAMRGVAVRIVNEEGIDAEPGKTGRMVVRTPDMMVGYWNETLMTHRAVREGWLDTGDLAWADDDGYLWFVGRVKEMIARGAFKVSPAMVEEVLVAFPGIERAAVVGLSDAVYGQLPFAFYQLKLGANDPGEDALRKWATERLELLAVPVNFVPIEQWPITTQGKLDRNRLIWMAEAGAVL